MKPSAGQTRRIGQAAILLLTVLMLAAAGCENRVLWSYRDDPYIQEYAQRGERACIAKLKSVYVDDRQVALRVLAQMAADARARGDRARADRLVALLIERFDTDKQPEVRSCIVSICAPICGPGSRSMEAFLRRCIADGLWTVPAAFSLATIEPRKSVALLTPLTRHPSHVLRYEAALALTAAGDPQGADAVRGVIAEMVTPPWPRSLGRVPLAQARATLQNRACRLWGEGLALPRAERDEAHTGTSSPSTEK